MSLLMGNADPFFNQSYVDTLFTQQFQESIMNIINTQRQEITKLVEKLKGIGEVLGVIYLTRVRMDDYYAYKLTYCNHYIRKPEEAIFTIHSFKPRYQFEQIRDYITDYEPTCIKRLNPVEDPDNVLFYINDINETQVLFRSILNDTAKVIPNAKNKIRRYQGLTINPYLSTVSHDERYIPYVQTSNYYLRHFGYANNDITLWKYGLLDNQNKRLAICIYYDPDDYLTSLRIQNIVKSFVVDLKNFRKYDSTYKGFIYVQSRVSKKLLRLTHETLNSLPPEELQDNPENLIDVEGNEILQPLDIEILEH